MTNDQSTPGFPPAFEPVTVAPPVPPAAADPGTPKAARLAWLLGVILVAAVVFLNQCSHKAEGAKADAAATIEAPGALDPMAAAAKIALKFVHLSGDASAKKQMLPSLNAYARTSVDHLRVAMLAAELDSAEEGLRRLTVLEQDRKLSEPVRQEIGVVRQVLESPHPSELPESLRTGLIDRHGWFAKLALTRGMDDASSERAPLLAGGGRVVVVMLLFILIAVVAVLGGLTCFIVAVVMLVTGAFKPAFRPPVPGGSVFLEVVAAFTGAFLLIKVLLPLLVVGKDGEVADWGMKFQLIVQWAVVPVIFWPVLRGMNFADFRRRLGWHSGRGFFREVGSGVFAYLASLPLLVVAAVASLVLLKLTKGAPDGEMPQVKNPVVDVITHAGPVELLMFFVLATCWAPLVEEAVFRGAFFGHLRSRVSLLLAAAVSAFVFGVMHGYEYMMLLPVMALGFSFALMREWRGSLVAPMTAHFLHNGTLMSFLILLLPVLRD